MNSIYNHIHSILVVHAKYGYETHEQYVKDVFEKHNIHDFEFMSEGDVSDFSSEELAAYFIPEIIEKRKKGTISCTLNHIKCYEKIVKNNWDLTLIFEDDPVFLGDFSKDLLPILNEVSKLQNGFIISLEGTTNKYPSFWQTKKNKYLYKARVGRCAGAYLVDYSAAKKMLEVIAENKCTEVIDWWHNKLISDNLISMYWAHPAIVEQASHSGVLSAEVSTKEMSFKRRFVWKIQKLYKNYLRRLLNQKRLISY